MITVEQWRVSIGSFHPHYHKQGKKKETWTSHEYFDLRLTIERVLVCILLLCLIDVVVTFLIVAQLLIDGDIESNPGPTYNIIKFVKASFHQGNLIFGYTAGTQCACNALISICWGKIKSPGCWKSHDLDHVLIKGDKLYKNINLMRYLGPTDLPSTLWVEEAFFNIKYIQLVTAEIKMSQLDFLRPSFSQFSDKSNGILFFINQGTIAILWDAKSFFLFDSHSRDEQGKVTENGTGVLLKFSALRQLQNYLTEIYLILSGRESIFCQIQYVMVEIDCAHNSLVQLKKISNKRKLPSSDLHTESTSKIALLSCVQDSNLQKLRERRASENGTPKHKEILQNMRGKICS